ncbi:MAG: UDP-N-acetylmuramoyl-L-alanine--D-glutamate ligase, partial [Nitratireductor sp.]
MISASTQKDKRIALFGLGGSGMVTAHALKAGGAMVYCYDDNPDRVKQAKDEGLNTADLHDVDFATLDALVLAPGVPLTHPIPHWTVDLANAARVPIIGDIELFRLERNAKAGKSDFIAITGTNGKSTTTALIAHVFACAGYNVQLGGNIGTAVLSLQMDELDDDENNIVYIVECSSYQIDLAPSLNPSIGLLLNLAPDHLDRHGSMAHYASVKARLVTNSDYAVVGVDDAYSDAISKAANASTQVLRVSNSKELTSGISSVDGDLVKYEDSQASVLFTLANAPALRGIHNAQNAAAAWAVCEKAGLSAEQIANGFQSFPGLAHRMEQLGTLDDVLFVNDSKGTNADASAMALGSFDDIYWIAGGLAKAGGIEELRPYFKNIKKAYLIGEAAPDFAVSLGEDVPFEISNTLDVAVEHAAHDAKKDMQKGASKEAVVLLSPACAS